MATTAYPIPAFHFKVDWGGSNMGFSEVSGLNVETQILEYRHGLSPDFSTIKMTGMQKYGNLTLKRGVMPTDNEFYDLWNTHQLNKVERRDITISLLDENHNPVVVWKVRNAFAVKVDGGSLKAGSNEISIETLELAHEGLSMEKP